MRRWQAKFGDTFTVRDLLGTTVITADPKMIEQLFAAREPDLFEAIAPSTFDVLLGRRSLLLLSQRDHQRERKVMARPFIGPRLRTWTESMLSLAREAVEELAPGEEFEVVDRARAVGLEIVLRVIFGVESERRQAYRDVVGRMLGALHPAFLLARGAQRDLAGLSPFRRFRLASAELDALLMERIEAARAGSAAGDDLLSAMVEARDEHGRAMSDESVRDELRTLLVAAYETTAITIAWAMHFVHQHPEVLTRVRDELAGTSDAAELVRLPWLGAIVDETLRLRPTAGQIYRCLARPWQWGSWSIPAGTTLSVAVPLVHLREDLWPEAERWKPERFLAGPPSPCHFLPFGGGSYRCLGAGFGRHQAMLVVAAWLRALELEPRRPERVRWRRVGLTLGPSPGIRMRTLERRA